MPRRFRDGSDATRPESARPRRPDRRRTPGLEGLEGRQLLSAAHPAVTVSVSSPDPAVERSGIPVTVRYTNLPPLRAWAGQEFEGVVASFISNAAFSPDRLAASIDWGDGQTSPGSVELSPWGGFNVRGAHTYEAAVQGITWVRIDVADVETGQWITGVEQRAVVSRPSPTRAAMHASGMQTPASQFEPTARAQPVRLRFVERRQRYHEAADRFVQGVASADDLRYLKQVKDFQDQQNKGYFEKIGDSFSKSWPFG